MAETLGTVVFAVVIIAVIVVMGISILRDIDDHYKRKDRK